jgi:hypothetical protein
MSPGSRVQGPESKVPSLSHQSKAPSLQGRIEVTRWHSKGLPAIVKTMKKKTWGMTLVNFRISHDR